MITQVWGDGAYVEDVTGEQQYVVFHEGGHWTAKKPDRISPIDRQLLDRYAVIAMSEAIEK